MNFRNPDQLLMPWSPRYTISAARAAEILNVSRQTVIRMCEAGSFMAYQVRPGVSGSPWRINRDSFEAYIRTIYEKNGIEQRF
jgi:excisionase family DNA binding protein